ncbi:MAG: carboxypeptidase-like regulatory domain-containing protein [Collimonas sp.]
MQPKSENGFTYLCGGVGLDESAYMKRAAKKYDLMSTFATRTGGYLADVNIDISDKSGKAILQTTCSGPIMLIKFPHAGTYRVRAEVGGNAQTKVAQVQAKRSTHSVVFVWAANQE